MNTPKVVATRFGAAVRKEGDPAYSFRAQIEWAIVAGQIRSGKCGVLVRSAHGEAQVERQVKDQVAAHLAEKFAPEPFQDRDVLVFGF